VSRADEARAGLTDALQYLAPDELEAWLLDHSDLPGPRSNLELVAAAADLVPADLLRDWAARTPEVAPSGTALEYVPVCGVVGLGRLLVETSTEAERRALLDDLASHADDTRWRVREAVAMALQRWGASDFDSLLAEMRRWAAGPDRLHQRAVVAALCEPPLLRDEDRAADVVEVLDGITKSLASEPPAERRTEPFRVLRQALGYGWSVAIVAAPAAGRARMERWIGSTDHDVRWVMRENLKKARLTRMDAAWVARMRERVGA
jgi:hypothetical protein